MDSVQKKNDRLNRRRDALRNNLLKRKEFQKKLEKKKLKNNASSIR